MKTKLVTAPTVEPITLAEAELHLRINSNSLADDLGSVQSIAPGAHVVAAAYSLVGDGVDVLNYAALVILSAGTNGASGTVDVKIQESDDDSTYTDWSGGAFTQVTEANDNATQEKEYTGIKQYIRVVSTVATATCSFGVNVLRDAPASVEDDYIEALIKAARQTVEFACGYRLITQTWELALDEFPSSNEIQLPHAPLQSVTSVTYYDGDEDSDTFEDFFSDTYSKPGKIVLKSGYPWPSTTLRTVNGVVIQYVLGFGLAADVPENYKTAIKMLVGEFYENREAYDRLFMTKTSQLPFRIQALIGPDAVEIA